MNSVFSCNKYHKNLFFHLWLLASARKILSFCPKNNGFVQFRGVDSEGLPPPPTAPWLVRLRSLGLSVPVAGLSTAATHDLSNSRLLVDELEYVRRVNEYSDCSADSNREKDEQLESVDYHRDVSPVFDYLQRTITKMIHTVPYVYKRFPAKLKQCSARDSICYSALYVRLSWYQNYRPWMTLTCCKFKFSRNFSLGNNG